MRTLGALALSPASLSMDFNRRLVQRVTLLGQPRLPRNVRVQYEVTPPGAAAPVTLTVPFVSEGLTTPQGVEVIVNLAADREEILRRLDLPRIDSTVVLHRVGLEVEQLSAEWAQPEAPVNIENGFGFFGSVSRYVASWTLAAEDAAQVGFRTPE